MRNLTAAEIEAVSGAGPSELAYELGEQWGSRVGYSQRAFQFWARGWLMQYRFTHMP